MNTHDPFAHDAGEDYTPPASVVAARRAGALAAQGAAEEPDDPRTGDSSVEPPEEHVTDAEVEAELGLTPADAPPVVPQTEAAPARKAPRRRRAARPSGSKDARLAAELEAADSDR